MTSIKDVFNATKKGSKYYKAIWLQKINQVKLYVPDGTSPGNMRRKCIFTFWKTLYLPSNLQNLHLQIINQKLKLNDQLRYFARDENNQPVSGNCTFCTINNIEEPSEESYRHLFLECASIIGALNPIANRFNINLTDMEEEGDARW